MRVLKQWLTWLPALAAFVALAFGTVPAEASSKQDQYDEMIAIASQVSAIKGSPAAAAQVQQLLARYDQLSADLGGDDPGSVLDYHLSGSGPLIVPPAPPNCVFDVLGGTFTRVLNAPIDDSTPVQDTQAVAIIGNYIYDVDVVVNITHTFAADLDFTVTSPGGTVVTLSTDNGGGNNDVFVNTIFDDDAGDSNPPGPVSDVAYVNLVAEPTVAPKNRWLPSSAKTPTACGRSTRPTTPAETPAPSSPGSWSSRR